MADLVKRLRTRGEATRAMGWTDLEDEAADAIEQLAGALAVVRFQLDGKWRLPPPVELAINDLLSKYGASNG